MNKLVKNLTLGLLMATIALGPVPAKAGQANNLEKPSDIIRKNFIENRKHKTMWEELKHDWLFWDNLSEAMSTYDTQSENNKVLLVVKQYRYSYDDFFEVKTRSEIKLNIKTNVYRIIAAAAESSNFSLFKQLYYHQSVDQFIFSDGHIRDDKNYYFPAFKLIINTSHKENTAAMQWITSLEKYYYQTGKISPADTNYYDLMLFLDHSDSLENTLSHSSAAQLIEPAILYNKILLLARLLTIINPEAKSLQTLKALEQETYKSDKMDTKLLNTQMETVKNKLQEYATAQAKLNSLSKIKESIIEQPEILHIIAQYY